MPDDVVGHGAGDAPSHGLKGTMASMRKFALIVMPLLLVLALGFAACGKGGSTSSGSSNGTVQLTSDNFAVNSATINAGQSITFVDPSSATLHILCIGKDMSCSGAAGPDALTNGHQLTINPGETKQVTFPTKGDYPITCTVHQNMDMVVHVS